MTETQFDPIRIVEPRENVHVTFPDGLVLEGPVGTTIEQFLKTAECINPSRHDSAIMGGILDGKLRELSYPVKRDADLQPVLLSSSDGGRIYRRSLVMLLTTAVEELWPGLQVSVRYAVPDGGFYCTVLNRHPLNDEELQQLEDHIRKIVEADDKITKRIVTLDEAKALFASRNEDDKVRLLEQRTRNDLTLYRLRNRDDYYYGYMVPSTGYLQIFRLIKVSGGFILQYPRKEHPTELREIKAYSKLGAVFQQTDDWLDKMEVEDIGRLNRAVREDKIHELILIAEALHEQNIAQIAGDICANHETHGTRIVLIAGPSSSGKTTFSKRLAIQLMANGLRPFTLELDNYFVDRELTPRDEKGDYDFEALGAINLALFNQQLLSLVRGEQVRLPKFNFLIGKSEEGATAQLSENQIIIVEGIHGLNPALVPDVPDEAIFRVYVSALTQLNVDAHNRIPTTDVRLLRRIARDARYRGYNATDTLQRWQSVRRGEKRNIFPYQENADAMFNSALVYEVAALRPVVESLLLQVEVATPPHIEANRLLSFLRWVHPLSEEQREMIPDTSLLREFIGGSTLRDYHPGRH
ncbi:MAG: nucleoside kinase [Chloroflexi bacterium]|nr:MAG: nucleoside kinase [Phototrophicales bacterium]RMF80361.1 MAG: nucleoside kinase [Chloroflexota bacterium]